MDRLNHSKIDSNMNKTLKEVLKLQDSAQDAEVIGAVNRLIENNDRLTRENQDVYKRQVECRTNLAGLTFEVGEITTVTEEAVEFLQFGQGFGCRELEQVNLHRCL